MARGHQLERPHWIYCKLAIVGLNAVKQPDGKVNFAAFKHRKRAGTYRFDQLHMYIGIALGIPGQKSRQDSFNLHRGSRHPQSPGVATL